MQVKRIVVMASVLVWLGGCADEKSARRVDDTLAMGLTMQQVGAWDTRRGFVDGHGDRLDVKRHEARGDELIDRLAKLKGTGTPAQQAMVHQMLASEQAFMARYRSGQAGNRWAKLSRRSAGLLRDLDQIEWAAADAALFASGDDLAQSQLHDHLVQTGRRAGELTARVRALGERIGEQRAAMVRHEQRRTASEAAAAQGRQRIGDAEAAGILELADQIKQAADAAVKAEADKKVAESKARVLVSEQRVLERQLALSQEAQDAVREQLDQMKVHQASVQEERTAQLGVLDDAFERLETRFHRLTEAYGDQIDRKLTGAANLMDAAIVNAQQAARQTQRLTPAKARRQAQRQADLAVAAMRLGKVHVLWQHVLAAGSMAHSLETVAAGIAAQLQAMGPQQRGQWSALPYQKQAEFLRQQQSDLIDKAVQLAQEGAGDVEALNGSTEDEQTDPAVVYGRLFAEYLQRIETRGWAVVPPAPEADQTDGDES